VTVRPTDFHDIRQDLPANFRSAALAEIHAGETLLAWFEPNLDAQLNYSSGLVLLTDQRMIGFASVSGKPPLAISSWPLDDDTKLDVQELGGAGLLELLTPESRLACWRFTAGQASSARRFVDRLKQFHRGETPVGADASDASDILCPSCGSLMAADRTICPVCAAAPASRPAATLWRLVRFARKRAALSLLTLVLTIAATAASMVPPYITKPMIDNVLVPYQDHQPVDSRLIPFYLTGLALASVISWLLGWARTFVAAWVSERIAADLRTETYSHLQRLSLEYFGGKRTGDLISRVSTDTDRICNFLSVNLLDFANDILMILMTAGILLVIDWRLAVATLVPLPIIAWLVHNMRSKLRVGFQLGSRAWGEMTSVLADTIPGIRVVKAFAQEAREIERFRKANDRVLMFTDRVNRLWSFFGPAIAFLSDLGMLVVWVVGVWRVSQGVTVGTLTLFVAYISRFYSRLESMSRIVSAVQRTVAATQRVFGILDREATVQEPAYPVRPARMEGRIELRQVAFRYGSRPVIENVNLTIEPGEMIGLVGASGSGKTTLVNLVCRFYDVAEGAILVDDIDIRSFAINDYRRHIGLVLQEPFLFYGTVAENIAYGRPDAGRAEIISAARAARAHEFILRLPDGYDSMVGERGQSLSGGERQRISIARALLIDPRILILDEATSAVDTETEREIQLALGNLIRGRTTIAIAHRLSTLAMANRLVVMQRGKIVEVGPHEELLDRKGVYSRLYHAQVELAGGNSRNGLTTNGSLPGGLPGDGVGGDELPSDDQRADDSTERVLTS
jgi:ATP-binding cassette subfamily B protein